MSAAPPGAPYRREIDGLRALAVLAVMLFHAGVPQFAGGYVGVDVFLVISGFLITGILLDDIARGDFSLRRFYERRARRILPALFLVLACTTLAALFVLTPREMVAYARSLGAVAAFGANFFFWRQGDYFDSAAELQPLLHTWSLAVEEQYYLLFPLLLLWLVRGTRPVLKPILVLGALAFASLALSAWGAWAAPRASFFLLPARAWELLVGAGLAFWVRRGTPPLVRLPWLREALALAGLAAVAAAVAFFDGHTPFPGVHALLPTLGTALLILHAHPATLVGRALASRACVAVGLVSYSAYLWHQPMLALARVHAGAELSVLAGVGWCALALVLAFASWRFVEQPIRRHGVSTQRTVLAWSLAGLAAFVLLGAAGVATRGFEAVYLARLGPAELRMYDVVRTATAGDLRDDMVDDGGCRFWSAEVSPQFLQRYLGCTANGAKALVVLGDSHGMNIYNALARVQAAPVLVGLVQPGCHPHGPAARCHYAAFAQFAAEHGASMVRVIYHQSGSYLVLDASGKPDQDRSFAEGERLRIDDAAIARVDAYLRELVAGGLQVSWLGPFPEPRRDMRDMRLALSERGFSPQVAGIFLALESRIAAVATRPDAGYRYLPMLGRHLALGEPLWQEGCLMFRDKDHLSICGEQRIGTRMLADAH